MPAKSRIGRNLVLANANQNYRISDLIQALDGGSNNYPINFAEIRITVDAAAVTPVLMGDAKLGAADYGDSIAVSATLVERSGKGCNDVETGNIYVRTVTAGAIIHFAGRVA